MKSNWPYPILALISGALLPLAFAPFHFVVIALLSPAALLYAWLNATPKQAAFRGWLYGIGQFGVGISWVYISIHNYGQAPVPLAALITCLFILYLALFPTLQGYLFTRLFPKNNLIKLVIVFPCSWVVFELLRSWLFTGFPWLLLGYTQSNTWLNGYAPLIGVYGISLIVACCSALLVCVYTAKQFYYRAFGLFVCIALFLIGLFLQSIAWTTPVGSSLKATLIQGNVAQELKWAPEQILKNLALYTKYTEQNWDSDLIIWPEAAIAVPWHFAQDFLNDLAKKAKQHNVAIITGIPTINGTSAHNSVIAVGNGHGLYDKRHLVPFGEYTPLKPFYNIIMQSFNIPMSNFDPGASQQQPLFAHNVYIAPYICYEIAYPMEFLTFFPKAQLLLTVTDDSWFGKSIALAQHLQMAQMRALETGRYLLFSSNTGITAAINAKGQIQKVVSPYQETTLTTEVQPMQGVTPWMQTSIYPVILFLLFSLIVAWRRRKD
jgi:apolipoprotein N-acyltransferase